MNLLLYSDVIVMFENNVMHCIENIDFCITGYFCNLAYEQAATCKNDTTRV